MLRKFYNNNTLSTHRPTQKVATCQILSAKTKSRILSDGEFQITDPKSAKTIVKVVEEVQKCSLLDP